MAAGTGPPHRDAVLVDVIFCGMRPQEPERRLAILELSRKDRVLAEAIVQTGHHPALGQHPHRRAVLFAAFFPRAAVDPHQHRALGGGIWRDEHVQFLPLVAFGNIGHVFVGQRGLFCCAKQVADQQTDDRDDTDVHGTASYPPEPTMSRPQTGKPQQLPRKIKNAQSDENSG